MKSKSLLTIFSFVMVATACGGSSSAPDNVGSPGSTSNPSPTFQPSSGEWSASAGFGTFDFTVNSGSTAITKIAFKFQTWQCGGATRTGGVTISSGSGWAITNKQISITTNVDANLSMSISGTFNTATSASGSWSANSMGATCTGTWTASK